MSFKDNAHHCHKMLDSKICVQIKNFLLNYFSKLFTLNSLFTRALFCRPETTVERRSYDVPTISAVQGILRAIFNHDGIDYKINDIYVCRKIRYDSIVRNETKVMQDINNPVPYLLVNEERTLRSSSFLVNVEYIVGAEIVKTINTFSPKEHTLAQFYDMFFHRLNSGGMRHVPCLGQQEFTCTVIPYINPFVKSVYAGKTVDLGIMYQMKKIDKDGNVIPLFAETKIEDGRLVYGNFFVPYVPD